MCITHSLFATAAPAPQAFLNPIGKAQKRKGKRLFMPVRIALTGRMHGPDVGEILNVIMKPDNGAVDPAAFVTLDQRMKALKAWAAANL